VSDWRPCSFGEAFGVLGLGAQRDQSFLQTSDLAEQPRSRASAIRSVRLVSSSPLTEGILDEGL
jgi:hypothetical protein